VDAWLYFVAVTAKYIKGVSTSLSLYMELARTRNWLRKPSNNARLKLGQQSSHSLLFFMPREYSFYCFGAQVKQLLFGQVEMLRCEEVFI
jgi:hypothetical protein